MPSKDAIRAAKKFSSPSKTNANIMRMIENIQNRPYVCPKSANGKPIKSSKH